jgi:tetratricopeptide (TPR) repeat protein
MLIETKEGDRENPEVLRDIHAMVLSVILYVLMKEEPDFAALPSSRVFEIIAEGDGTSFYSRQISEYLKTIDKKESIPALCRILSGDAENEAFESALYIAGELAYPELIPCVMETLARLNSPGEVLDDAVEFMQSFGDPMSDYLLAHYPELPASCQMDALDYFTRTGGGKAVEFLDRYFESLPREMMEFALPLCEAVVYTKALDWLRKRHNKNYPKLQSAYLVLSLLSGIRDPIVEERLSIYNQREKETSELLDNLSFDAVLNKKITSLNLELTCKDCGESNIYPVTNILVYSAKHDPYIAEEIECDHCHSLSNFELTPKGMMSVSLEMARLGIFKDLKSMPENSPLKVIGGVRAFGKEMSLPEAIKRYEQKIRNDPSDAVAHFCLGNIYSNTGQPRKSITLYETAIKLDPAYLQPYHSLAEIEEAGGNYQKALDYLEQGRKFIDSWKYYQADQVTQSEFAEHYREFHLHMLKATQSNCLPMFKDDLIKIPTVSSVPKVGRNDPCPCGSGKKYKKCCLAK